MIPTSSHPYRAVTASAACYHVLSRIFTAADASAHKRVTVNKAISAGHATLTTVLSLVALVFASKGGPGQQRRDSPEAASEAFLDDSGNPLIQDRNELCSALTAWEAGYLLYDTLALISLNSTSSGTVAAVWKTIRKSPALMAHHVLLASGLLYLQTYISRQKDKGIRIITAFLLMNASTPLLHARWWARKQGKPTGALDAAFIFMFAISRFGPIGWVMSEYGEYHGMSSLEAWAWLRKPCRAGTAGLLGMNAVWWLLLVKGAVKRSIKGHKKI